MLVSGSLITAPCEGNVLCRERKTSSVSSSGVLGVSAGALQCPLHTALQECPGWGSRSCWCCFLTCTALAGGRGIPGAYPVCLPLLEQEVFLGAESQAGKDGMVAQFLDRQMQYGRRGKRILLFASFLSWSCLCIPSAGGAGNRMP